MVERRSTRLLVCGAGDNRLGRTVNSHRGTADRFVSRRRLRRLVLVPVVGLWCLSSGVSVVADATDRPARPGEVRAQSEQVDATPSPSCATGRLVIGDLPAIEEDFEDGVAAEMELAADWHDDARLVGLRVGCRLLDDGFNWRGIFFSDAIQTYWYSDTGVTRTVDAVAPPGPTLPLDDVSFTRLHRSLIRAGYTDETELNPTSNVEIRLNSDEAPFGPPSAPRGEVYVHVAIESRGGVVDLFVSAEDGTIYRYPAA